MADFQFTPLVRETDGVVEQVAFPRALEITVLEAHSIFPLEERAPTANRLLFFAGSIEFGVDGDVGEDSINKEVNEEAEVDEGEQRTVRLRLLSSEAGPRTVLGSASVAAPGYVYLAGNHGGIDVLPDVFGVNVANALTQQIGGDVWLLSDVVAELGSQMNRMSYQANVLTTAPVQ